MMPQQKKLRNIKEKYREHLDKTPVTIKRIRTKIE